MIRDRLLCCAFALFLAVLLTSLPLFAQKITGDISGTVQDSTGAVVKDATITAKNIGTGETRSAKAKHALPKARMPVSTALWNCLQESTPLQ